jgi:hypothetical protein
VRAAVVLALLLAVGCGGGNDSAGSSDSYSADAVVACLRDDDGLLVPENDVIDVREGFSVEDPERNMSLRLRDETEPAIRGEFTMVNWYGAEEELSKVQLFFAPTEAEAAQLREERAENSRKGGASEHNLHRDLERRKNLVLVWDQGSTEHMRDQIAACLEG